MDKIFKQIIFKLNHFWDFTHDEILKAINQLDGDFLGEILEKNDDFESFIIWQVKNNIYKNRAINLLISTQQKIAGVKDNNDELEADEIETVFYQLENLIKEIK